MSRYHVGDLVRVARAYWLHDHTAMNTYRCRVVRVLDEMEDGMARYDVETLDRPKRIDEVADCDITETFAARTPVELR